MSIRGYYSVSAALDSLRFICRQTVLLCEFVHNVNYPSVHTFFRQLQLLRMVDDEDYVARCYGISMGKRLFSVRHGEGLAMLK